MFHTLLKFKSKLVIILLKFRKYLSQPEKNSVSKRKISQQIQALARENGGEAVQSACYLTRLPIYTASRALVRVWDEEGRGGVTSSNA